MDSLKRWQAEAILTRYRDPEDPFAVLVISICVLCILAVIGLGMAASAGVAW